MTLERFECFLEQIRDDRAFIRLESQLNGDVLYGEHSASALATNGIRERRRFYIDVMEDGSIEYTAIPDKKISKERQREMFKEVEEKLSH